MIRPLMFMVVFLIASIGSAKSIGTYSGCKPLGRWKQACLDCVGGGNFWQSGHNVCGLPGQAKKAAAEADDDDDDTDYDAGSSGIGGGGISIFSGLWLMLLGVLGASTFIIARQPNAKDLIAKVAPYQGWIGAVSALWGLWSVISSLLHIGWLSIVPTYWLMFTISAVLQLGLGLLLGVGVLKSFVKHPAAGAKLDATVVELTPYQSIMGLAAIAVGLGLIIISFI